jgi:hypothetical protein
MVCAYTIFSQLVFLTNFSFRVLVLVLIAMVMMMILILMMLSLFPVVWSRKVTAIAQVKRLVVMVRVVMSEVSCLLFLFSFCMRRYPKSCIAGLRLRCAMNEFLMIFFAVSSAESFVSFRSLGVVHPYLQNLRLGSMYPMIHHNLSTSTNIVIGPSLFAFQESFRLPRLLHLLG